MTKVWSIIAVDDSMAILAFIERALPPSRFRVFTAGTVEAGADLVQSHFPDLILLDRDIEGKDGIQFLRTLRANPAFDSVPVVMVTANKSQESVSECLRAGATDYLGKPFDQRALLDRVVKALDRAARMRTTSGKISTNRVHGKTSFEFPGGIPSSTIQEFAGLLQGTLGIQTKQDRFVLDLRAQPELTPEQAAAVTEMFHLAGKDRTFILVGRNFARFLDQNLPEEHLFLSESDLDEYFEHHR